MSGPNDGTYLITSTAPSAPPPQPIGATHGIAPVSRVIVGGTDNVWTVERNVNGIYTLTLQKSQSPWLSKGLRENVVVENTPPAGEWVIHGYDNSDSYSIEVPSDGFPTTAWTLDSTRAEPGTEVTLSSYEVPRPTQLWNFTPINDK